MINVNIEQSQDYQNSKAKKLIEKRNMTQR